MAPRANGSLSNGKEAGLNWSPGDPDRLLYSWGFQYQRGGLKAEWGSQFSFAVIRCLPETLLQTSPNLQILS